MTTRDLFDAGQQFSIDVKVRELERELNLRRRCYPRWVRAGRISPMWAEEKIQILEAVIADYQVVIARHRTAHRAAT